MWGWKQTCEVGVGSYSPPRSTGSAEIRETNNLYWYYFGASKIFFPSRDPGANYYTPWSDHEGYWDCDGPAQEVHWWALKKHPTKNRGFSWRLVSTRQGGSCFSNQRSPRLSCWTSGNSSLSKWTLNTSEKQTISLYGHQFYWNLTVGTKL